MMITNIENLVDYCKFANVNYFTNIFDGLFVQVDKYTLVHCKMGEGKVVFDSCRLGPGGICSAIFSIHTLVKEFNVDGSPLLEK